MREITLLAGIKRAPGPLMKARSMKISLLELLIKYSRNPSLVTTMTVEYNLEAEFSSTSTIKA